LGVQLDDKEHKSHVDALIRECFDKLNGVDEAQPSQVGNGSVTQNVSSNGASAAAQAPAPKIALPGMGGVPGSHVASAPKSSTNDIKPTIPSASGVKRKPKNDDIVSEDEDGDIEAVKRKAVAAKKTTTSVKKKRKTSTTADGVKKPPNPNNPFNKPVVLSAEMSRLCGAPEVCCDVAKRTGLFVF
jgi:upstream activation factor subunit UAF30